MSKVLCLVAACLALPVAAIADGAYDGSYALTSLPIVSITLNSSFTVRVGKQEAVFQNGAEVVSTDYSQPFCVISLKGPAINGAVINPNALPVTFAVDHVSAADGYGTIYPQGAQSIKYFYCSADSNKVSTLGIFQQAFGSNVTLQIHDPDIINPAID